VPETGQRTLSSRRDIFKLAAGGAAMIAMTPLDGVSTLIPSPHPINLEDFEAAINRMMEHAMRDAFARYESEVQKVYSAFDQMITGMISRIEE
jgi:hypothetical protein